MCYNISIHAIKSDLSLVNFLLLEESMDLSNKNLSLKRAQRHVHKPGYKFPVEKRIEVVTKWLALGNMRLVAELTGVSYQLCRLWKMEPWWPELVEEVKASRTLQLDNKLAKIVDKSLDAIADRLENGDVFFNQKTGTIQRKEVSLRDATKVATDLLQRQDAIYKQQKDAIEVKDDKTIKDQLSLLAAEFAKFNKKNTGPIQDAIIVGETNAIHEEREEGLQTGGSSVYEQTGSEEEESYAECSEEGDDEGREGSQR